MFLIFVATLRMRIATVRIRNGNSWSDFYTAYNQLAACRLVSALVIINKPRISVICSVYGTMGRSILPHTSQ